MKKNPFSGALQLAKKNPAATVAVIGGVVAVALVSRSRGSTQSVVASTPTLAGDQVSQASPAPDYSSTFDEIGATLEGLDEKINAYGLETSKYTGSLYNQLTDRITGLSTRIADISNDQDNLAASITAVPIKPATVDPFNDQVAAYRKILDLKKSWSEATTDAAKDRIHAEAEAIAISAGFGAGGASGADRKIPDAVIKAVGG